MERTVNGYERELGTLTAKINRLESDVSEMKNDVRLIKEAISEARGGWKAIALVAGISGTIGALIAKFAPFFFSLPR